MTTGDVDTGGPRIAAAHVAPGHDGLAEVVVEVRYPNGAVRSLSLPLDAVEPALDRAGVRTLDDLVGRGWATLAACLPSAQPDRRTP